MSNFREIMEVKRRTEKGLRKYPHVKGVGVGYKEIGGEKTNMLAIVVTVDKKLSPLELKIEELIPRFVEGGVATDVIEVGALKAGPPQAASTSRTSRYRPSPCGVSIGHYAITAGTQGLIVKNLEGQLQILSNNHVLANENAGSIGDDILQPGPYDGGKDPHDLIAHLTDFVPLNFESCQVANSLMRLYNGANSLVGGRTRLSSYIVQGRYAVTDNEVDCAVAEPIDPGDVDPTLLDLCKPTGSKDPELDMTVVKSGRTTGVTEGEITLLDWSGDVGYGNNMTAHFVGQGLIQKRLFSQGGDSGSGILDKEDDRAVGLLFAGSDTTTIFNPINKVLQALQVSILV